MARFSANSESFEERRRAEMSLKRSKLHNLKSKHKSRESKLRNAEEAGKKHKVESRVLSDRKRKKRLARQEGDEPEAKNGFDVQVTPHGATSQTLLKTRAPRESQAKGVANDDHLPAAAHTTLPTQTTPDVTTGVSQSQKPSPSTSSRRVPVRRRQQLAGGGALDKSVFVANLVPDFSKQMERKAKRLFIDCGAILRTSISICPGTPMFHDSLTGPHRIGAYQGSIEFNDSRSVPLALKKHLTMFEGRQIVVCRTAEEVAQYYDKIVRAVPVAVSKRSHMRAQPTILFDLKGPESHSEVLTDTSSPVECQGRRSRPNLFGFSFGTTIT